MLEEKLKWWVEGYTLYVRISWYFCASIGPKGARQTSTCLIQPPRDNDEDAEDESNDDKTIAPLLAFFSRIRFVVALMAVMFGVGSRHAVVVVVVLVVVIIVVIEFW